MAIGAEGIAERLRAAYAVGPSEGGAAMAELFADEIDIRHVPPHDYDGPAEGARVAELSRAESSASRKGILDAEYTMTITVDGDWVRMVSATRGRFPDGRPAALDTDVRIELRDDRIVTLEAHWDPAALKNWGDVLSAGDFDSEKWLDEFGEPWPDGVPPETPSTASS